MLYKMEDIYLKYSNQTLKIICTSLVIDVVLLLSYLYKLNTQNQQQKPTGLHLNIQFLEQNVIVNEKWVLYKKKNVMITELAKSTVPIL